MLRTARPVLAPIAFAVVLATLVPTTLADVSADHRAVADELLAARDLQMAPYGNPNARSIVLEDNLKAARRAHGKRSLQAADASVQLAMSLMDNWKRRRLYDKALSITADRVGRSHPLYGRHLAEAAAGLIYLSSYRNADDYLERAHAFYSDQPDALESALLMWLDALRLSQDKGLGSAVEAMAEAGANAARLVPQHGEAARKMAIWAYSRPAQWLHAERNIDALNAHSVALARLFRTDGAADPRLLVVVSPELMPDAPRAMPSGKVHYTLSVDDVGRVTDVRVDRIEGPDELGPLFGRAAALWQFTPRIVDGDVVPCRVRNTYQFY